MPNADGRGVTLLNARNAAGELFSVRIMESRIAGLDVIPQPGDLQIDLRGDRVLPGLINAHDHLQLNSLPRLKYRDRYSNVVSWIADIRPRLKSDPLLIENHAVPRADRLLIGGLKNLLSGATTVAHHDPLYPFLLDEAFPTRVVANYGWSHSLLLDGAEAVRRSHRQTPVDWPWIIHAAEGIDAGAASEFERLESLGCLTANTLIVHGLALNRNQQRQMEAAGAGMIWCPSSNLHLFGRTVDIRELFAGSRVALGSDSRLTGGRDLLAELRLASTLSGLDEASLESLVTERAARLLRLPDRGVLKVGALADILVLPEGLALSRTNRADIRLVLVGGALRYGDPEYAQAFETDPARVQVDGRLKCLPRSLAAQLANAKVHETGLKIGQTRIELAAQRILEATL